MGLCTGGCIFVEYLLVTLLKGGMFLHLTLFCPWSLQHGSLFPSAFCDLSDKIKG